MCMRPMHVLGGAYAGAGLAWATHQPWWVIAASAAIAAATAPGPDMDQRKWWRRLDRWVPDEWLGWGGPLQHRGITHWWALPAAVGAALYLAAGPWWAWALLAGWASHLALDWVFGMADPWSHRGPGIPVWPWWGHVGLGFDAGGLLERAVLVPTLAVAGPAIVAWPYAAPLVHAATTAWEATR